MSGALSDLKVVDLTQMLAGPFCSQFFADHGAQVIKVESFGGDMTRQMGPYLEGEEDSTFSGYFQSVNRNKRSIVLDLKSAEGKQVLRRLIDDSDVVLENFRAGVMDRLGFSYEELRTTNPALVYGTVRGFGDPRSGASPYSDWPAYDVVAQAMGGLMGITGVDKNSPMKAGPGIGDTVPALMLGFGVLAAVHHARRTGVGQFVDVAMLDGVLSVCERIVYQRSYSGKSPAPEGNRHPLLSPFGLFRARDGWVSIACPNDDFWQVLAAAIERPELSTDPQFATNAARVRNIDAVVDAIEGFTRRHTKAFLVRTLGGKIPFGPVYTADDVFQDQHYKAREMIVDVEHPASGRKIHIAGVPVKLSETPGAVRCRAPLLGEHTDEILQSLGYDRDTVADLRQRGIIR